MQRFQRFLSILLVVCFANATMLQAAQAALVTTEQVARLSAAESGAAEPSPHARLATLLARADVQSELERFGLSPELASERIAALTDDEASRLAQQIDSAPAGSGVLGAILLVFFVLLLTDILGFTKIFPFTRSVR